MMRSFLAPGWRGHLTAIIAGALITLSLAPFSVWPAGLLALVLLHRLLAPLTARQAFARGWWFGVGLFLTGASWVYVSIHDYGYAPVPLAAGLTIAWCLALALLSGGFAWSYVRWLRDLPGGCTLGFAACWVLWEWIRAWLLTGFPWLYIGYAHLNTPLAGWAPVLGIYGVDLIIALSAAAIASLLASPRTQRRWAPLVVSAVLWLGGWLLTFATWTQPNGEPVKVGLVQANIPQSVKWDRDSFQHTLDLYARLSAPLWNEVQVVIWPEAAIPTYYDLAQPFFDGMGAIARAHDVTLVSGVPYREAAAGDGSGTRGEMVVYNSAMAFGAGDGLYHKQHLVPFGEYIPLEQWLRGLIHFLDMPMSDFRAGPAGQSPLRAGAITLAPYICYEVVYPDLVRLARADVLITLSNDAWFGHSIGPLQHLQMAQMRALENGRDMIRATGNGVTALIDERGRITRRVPQFEATTLVGSVQPRMGMTPFARMGSQPVLVLCALLVVRCLVLALITARTRESL